MSYNDKMVTGYDACDANILASFSVLFFLSIFRSIYFVFAFLPFVHSWFGLFYSFILPLLLFFSAAEKSSTQHKTAIIFIVFGRRFHQNGFCLFSIIRQRFSLLLQSIRGYLSIKVHNETQVPIVAYTNARSIDYIFRLICEIFNWIEHIRLSYIYYIMHWVARVVFCKST